MLEEYPGSRGEAVHLRGQEDQEQGHGFMVYLVGVGPAWCVLREKESVCVHVQYNREKESVRVLQRERDLCVYVLSTYLERERVCDRDKVSLCGVNLEKYLHYM